MRIALDSNILVYAVGVRRAPADDAKIASVDRLLPRLIVKATLVAPVQALSETYTVAVRSGKSRAEASAYLARFRQYVSAVPTTAEPLARATELAVDNKLQLWDAIILTAAAEAGCTLLLSEDMQHGFSWRGVTVLNPFLDPVDARLAPYFA